MSVRVRFAPSPTGLVHIGNARTAIYNYLFARKNNGTFIVRVEDTDLERSTREYENKAIADIKWLGLDYDEGPDKPGEYGPYRQSERLDIYKKHALDLIEKGQAFYCFCSQEALEEKKEKAMMENRSPHYDGTCRKLSSQEVTGRLENGEKAAIRFLVPKKHFEFKDWVRGNVSFPQDMVGDFIIIRSNDMPVYNYCCMIDDWLMKISHVIRGEDHLSNTLRQLMLYQAFEVEYPEFAHVSLLVGADRQKLSKRHGATTVTNYRQDSFLPQALLNYLCQLGWSHPDEKDIFTIEEAAQLFTLDRFTGSAALFDIEKLKFINGQHLRTLSLDQLVKGAKSFIPEDHLYHQQSQDWQERCLDLFKIKIELFVQLKEQMDNLFNPHPEETAEFRDIKNWETTPVIAQYLRGEIKKLIETGASFASIEDFDSWVAHIKGNLKIKGKPLFMGIRSVLTGLVHGPDVKVLVTLTPLSILAQRIG